MSILWNSHIFSKKIVSVSFKSRFFGPPPPLQTIVTEVKGRAATSSAFSRKILLFEGFSAFFLSFLLFRFFSAFLILCFLYLQPIFFYLKDHFQKYTDKFLSILADAFVFLWFFYKESSYFPLAAKNYKYVFFVFIPYLTYIFLSAIYSVVHLIYTNVLIF